MFRVFLQAGGSFARSAADARRVQFVNAITLVAIAIVGLTQPANVMLGDRLLSIINMVALVVFAVVYRCNAVGRPLLAASLLCLLPTASIVCQLAISGKIAGGTQVFLLAAALLPFLVFPARATRAAVAVSLAATVVLIVLVMLGHGQATMTAALGQPGSRAEVVYTAVAGLVVLFGYLTWRVLRGSELGVEREQRRGEALLFARFPRPVTRRLQRGERVATERRADASVLVCRVIAAPEDEPEAQLRRRASLFAGFDEVCARHGVERIKTFGGTYVAASGVLQARADHAEALAAAGLAMLAAAERLAGRVTVRIGLDAGPVVAGVVGRDRSSFDVWGETAETARRIALHGADGAMHVREAMLARTGGRLRGAAIAGAEGIVRVEEVGP